MDIIAKLNEYINKTAENIESKNKSETITAFDFGATSIKIIEFKNEYNSEKIDIVNFDIINFENIELTDKEITEKISQSVKMHNIKIDTCIFTVSSIESTAKIFKMPIIPHEQLKSSLKFKLKKEILFDINKSYADYHKIEDIDKSQNILATVIIKKQVNKYYNILKKFCNKILFCGTNSLSLCQLLSEKYKKEDNTIILDIGYSFTQMIIIKNGKMSFYRLVSMGIATIVETIAKHIYKDAASNPINQKKCLDYIKNFGLYNIKRLNETTVKVETESFELEEKIEEEIEEAIQNSLKLFTQNIRLSIGYYKTQAKQSTVNKIILCGGGSLIKKIIPFFEDQLSIITVFEDSFEFINVSIEDPFRTEYLRKLKLQFISVISIATFYMKKKKFKYNYNLLPDELIFKVDHPFLKAVKNPGLFFIPVGGLLMIILIIISIYNSFIYSSIKDDIKLIAKNKRKLLPIETNINNLSQEIENFNKKSEIIKNNLDDRLYLAKTLLEINNKTPLGMGISLFRFKRTNKIFIISGISLNTSLTTKCANDFGNITYLKDVRLNSSEVVNQNSPENQYVKYQIEGKIVNEKKSE